MGCTKIKVIPSFQHRHHWFESLFYLPRHFLPFVSHCPVSHCPQLVHFLLFLQFFAHLIHL